RPGRHAVRPGARGLPRAAGRPPGGPLEHPRPRGRRLRRRRLPRLPAGRRRAGHPGRLPARRPVPTPGGRARPRLIRGGDPMTDPREMVSVRYLVDDVQESIDFYTTHLGFELRTAAVPAFAEVVRGSLRLLLSGPKSSAGRPMADGAVPEPGGWNRIHFVVDDIDAEVERLRDAGLRFRNDVVTGPGGSQVLLQDPSGNLVELFQPAGAG